jgi:hypothetical protein
MKLHGLTLWEPWSWAILSLPEAIRKDVENRGWPMPAPFVGEWVALHAGRTYDWDGAAWIRQTFRVEVPPPNKLVLGAVTGLVKFAPSGRAVRSRWAVGPWCWPVLERVTIATTVDCRGFQKLWPVPPEVAEQVLAQAILAGGAGGQLDALSRARGPQVEEDEGAGGRAP